MGKIIIKTDKFDAVKQSLEELENNSPSVIYLDQFSESGKYLKFTTHNVTGEEANKKLVGPLQKTIITLNAHIINLQDFNNEIYSLVDWLDNEYTKGIESAIKAAEISSNQALEASNQALNASKKAEIASDKATKAQEDIKRTIEALKITVGKLKQYKETSTKQIDKLNGIPIQINNLSSDIAALRRYQSQLEAYEHLGDVDAIWGDVEQHKKNLTEFHQQLDGIAKEFSESAKQFISDIAALQDYKSKLENYEHLGDVDAIWANVEQHKKSITEFHQQLDGIEKEINESTKLFSSDIAALQDYKSKLENYEHLGDVDAIWANVEQHKKNLTEFHQQLDGIEKEISESAKLFKGEIAVLQNYKSQLEAYEHLGDVDAIWANVEQHKKILTEFHQQLVNFTTEYNSDRKDIQSSIETIIEENVQSNNAINKKIRVAYIVAGFSVTIAIVQFVLNLLHII